MRFAHRLILLAAGLCAQAAVAEEVPPRALTDDDVLREWRSIDDARLTPDGSWFVYVDRPCGDCKVSAGDVSVVVRSTRSDTERRYRAGDVRDGAGQLAMSASGRWVAYIHTGPRTSSAESVAMRSVMAVEVSSGRTIEIPGVCSFAFGGPDEWIAAQACSRNEFQLVLRKLDRERTLKLDAIREFSFDLQGSRIAYARAGELAVLELSSGRILPLDALSGAAYRKITWSKSGAGLAVVRITKGQTPSGDGGSGVSAPASNDLLVFTSLNSGSSRKTQLAPRTRADFPSGFGISADSVTAPSIAREALIWRDDERAVFFGIRRTQLPPKRSESGVVLWHWADSMLPAGREATAGSEARFSFLSLLTIPDGRFIRLADEALREVQPHTKSRYLLGFDTRAYDRDQNLTGRRARDYYRVELATGKRDLVIPKLELPRFGSDPVLSPDGSSFIFQSSGQLASFSLEQLVRRELTKTFPSRFSDGKQVPARVDRWAVYDPTVQGWTRDMRHVLLSDHFDIWAVPLAGGVARNLTPHGRRDRIRYIRATFDEGRPSVEVPVDLDRPVYFRTINERTGRTGLARRQPAGTIDTLFESEADVRYQKASGADVYICEKQTAVEAAQYFLINEWQPTRPLTRLNEQQRRYAWSPGARLISYVNSRGDELRAILHLPAGYVPGKAYPTIVSIYEYQSQDLHQYRRPSLDGFVALSGDIPRWTQHGYAILEPDIQPYVNESGTSALDAVSAAVKAAVATGIVDADRLGLEGHSYGGYETSFVVTHTNLFKAAVAAAGWSNLLGAYGYLYAPDRIGVPMSNSVESGQPFIPGPWWDHWDAFVGNSPLFSAQQLNTPLLLVHGDADSRVPFAQAVEFFNSLRRMGGKPVVLLQYRDGHAFREPKNLRDLTSRKMQFFDHFLKDQPAPDWWLSTSDAKLTGTVMPLPSHADVAVGSSF